MVNRSDFSQRYGLDSEGSKGVKQKRVFGVSVVAILLTFVMIAVFVISGVAHWATTSATQTACVYNGGPFDSRTFRTYEEPGSGRKYIGIGSKAYYAPTNNRQYRVSMDPKQGDTPTPDSVKTSVKGYPMQFEPTVNFTLNTEVVQTSDGKKKPTVCDLIETQLISQGATDFDTAGGKWQFSFLNERFRPVLNDVTTRVLQNYNPGDLLFNTGGARDDAAKKIASEMKVQLKAAFGKDYFCAPTYQFGQGAEACGLMTVILPEPTMADADRSTLAQPQKARIDADNAIAAAQEETRKVNQTADELSAQAKDAKRIADAQQTIADEQTRVANAQNGIDYAWCAKLVELGQRCDLVKAAESGDYPDIVVGGENGSVSVAVPTPTTTTTTTP